jgi:NitT/TauT family transport system permease protein
MPPRVATGVALMQETAVVGPEAIGSLEPRSRRKLNNRVRYWGTQVAAVGAFLLVWQTASWAAKAGVLPGPADALPRLADLLSSGQFVTPLVSSLVRTAFGFIGGITLGVAFGIAAGRSAGFRHVTSLVFQVALFANTLVVIFIGLAIFGNTNNLAAIVVCAISVFPTVAVYIRDVVMSMDDELLEMSAAYRTSGWRRAIDVYLPFLTPAMLACARIGFSLSWKIILLSEVFGLTSGIGWQIQQSYSAYRVASVMAWLGVFVITLLLIEQLIRTIERLVVRWR